MKTILRWWFWVFSLVLILGALGFATLVFGRFNSLSRAWKDLTANQNEVKRRTPPSFPNDATLAKANQLLDKTRGDLAAIAIANYEREFKKTNFELFFSDSGFVADTASIDPNRYRSAYERNRDEVLSRAEKEGKLVLPAKDASGFQYFEKAVELSPDALPLMQKRFWVAKAVYDTLSAYNSQPVRLAGFEFVEGEGEKKADLPASIASVSSVAHRGFYTPLDVPTDHAAYKGTRAVMEPFYYFKYWQVDVEIEAPAGAVPAILARFMEQPLPFAVRKVEIQRLKDSPTNRYALPLSRVLIGLSVLDFEQNLFADFIPELQPPLQEGQ